MESEEDNLQRDALACAPAAGRVSGFREVSRRSIYLCSKQNFDIQEDKATVIVMGFINGICATYPRSGNM